MFCSPLRGWEWNLKAFPQWIISSSKVPQSSKNRTICCEPSDQTHTPLCTFCIPTLTSVLDSLVFWSAPEAKLIHSISKASIVFKSLNTTDNSKVQVHSENRSSVLTVILGQQYRKKWPHASNIYEHGLNSHMLNVRNRRTSSKDQIKTRLRLSKQQTLKIYAQHLGIVMESSGLWRHYPSISAAFSTCDLS